MYEVGERKKQEWAMYKTVGLFSHYYCIIKVI